MEGAEAMKMTIKFPRCIVIVFLVLGAVSCSHTKGVSRQEPLTGEKILDSYIAATGGLENYKKLVNRYSEMTLSIPAAGIDLDIEFYNARPNRVFSVASSEALGEIRRGTDGIVFWENSLMSGPRLLEGEELSSALREATFDRYSQWRNYYTSAEYMETDTIDGKTAYKVIMTPAEGEPETCYFDAASGFMIRVESVFKHEMGDLPLVVNLDDYRAVDNILLPYKTTVQVMGQDRLIMLDSVSHNINMPDSLFAIPPDIQELMDN
jgi:hypothetical protein